MAKQQEETIVSAEETENIRKAWDAIATGYDRFVTPTHLDLSREALESAGVSKGDRFLDVAAGSGAFGVTAARMGAKVTAVDLSPIMVDRLKQRAADQGIEDLQAHVMDGHALDLEDGTFDMAGSQYGVMLFPDLPQGLREMVRVTRSGGKVVMVLYGPPQEVEFLAFFIQAVKSVMPDFSPPPLDAVGAPFQAADRDVLRTRLEEAGLEAIQIETLTEQLRFSSGDGLWDWLMNSNPVPRMLLGDATKEKREQVKMMIDRMVEERAGPDGVAVLTNPVHVGIGTKPAARGGGE